MSAAKPIRAKKRLQAKTRLGPKTRVWGFRLAGRARVGGRWLANPRSHWGFRRRYDGSASDSIQYYDPETDLFENWHRFYDPNTGRYLEPDPVWKYPEMLLPRLAAGHFDPVYAYAGNNPIGAVDPTGLVGDGTNDVQQVRTMADGTMQLAQNCQNGDANACTMYQAQLRAAVVMMGVANVAALAEAGMLGGLAQGAVDAAGGIFAKAGAAISSIGTAIGNVLKSGGGQKAPQWASQVHPKDAEFLSKAAEAVGENGKFDQYLGALNGVVNEAGHQIYKIGEIGSSAIYGSVRTGTGIAEVNGVTQVVRSLPGQAPVILGPLR